MNCPDCGSALVAESYADIQLEGCRSCGGVWLDPGELKQLVQNPPTLEAVEAENVPTVEQVESASPDRRCPKCESGLESYHYAYDTPVVLDSCVSCSGIWVQDGELAKIEQILEKEKGPITDREKAALSVAAYTIEHENEMARQRGLAGFFKLLRRRPPHWRLYV